MEAKRRLGFAVMTPEQRRSLAARGGRAAQRGGKPSQTYFTSEAAQRAGRKGGLISRKPGKRAVEEA